MAETSGKVMGTSPFVAETAGKAVQESTEKAPRKGYPAVHMLTGALA